MTTGYWKLLPLPLTARISCKGRGVCPSCNAKRAHVTAVHLVERVLPHVPYRQWTLSFPHRVRWVLLKDVGLLREGDEKLVLATLAAHPREAVRQHSAFQVLGEVPLHVPGGRIREGAGATRLPLHPQAVGSAGAPHRHPRERHVPVCRARRRAQVSSAVAPGGPREAQPKRWFFGTSPDPTA